jgi:predicted extracellular nuclease
MRPVVRRSFVAAVAVVFLLAGGQAAQAASPNLVLSQIYGGGGNASAQYTHDFIEIFNRGTTSVSLAGLSLQYASATGTGNLGANSSQLTELTGGTLAPGQYFLVQEASGTSPAPAPNFVADVIDATPINMAAGGGKVALVTGTTSLGCNGGSAPCSAAALARIIDLIGYDGANFFEGASAAPTLSNTTAAFRNNSGCTDTDNNGADFTAAAPGPRNTISPVNFCPADQAPNVASRVPAGGATGVATNANVTITFSEPVNVTDPWFSISCDTSGTHDATVSGGPTTFMLDPSTDFAEGETCTVTVTGSQVSDQDTIDPPDTMTADDTWTFTAVTPPPPATPIHDIQGASHISPLVGQTLGNVPGIVTAKRTNGFYLQDPNPDADDATSEGFFVFTSSAPNGVSVGDSVRVAGTVSEFRPGGATSGNLTTTELVSPTVTVVSTGNQLPASVVLGTGGRIPPDTVIEDDATGDVETSGVFDPASDGLDFYESVEGMRVQLNDAVAVGPTNSFGETPIVGDDGANASVRTARGGLLLRADDPNPERIVADDAIVSMPRLNVGDHYMGPIVGVVDYNFGDFFVEVTNPVARVEGGLQRETTSAPGAADLSVATFNFENLAATNAQSKFDQLAGIIVSNLRSPDLIAGEEVQDNNGAVDNGTVDASQTLTKLVAAIQAAGGPSYAWREIDPVDGQDGGEPGGNIRQVILFRTDRGLSFVDRPGGTSTDATGVTGSGASTQLTFSPGRIDPTNSAWNASRKALAGELSFRGHPLFVVVNHFNSKGGDQPLSGQFQPPVRSSETQRHEQAHLVADFVSEIKTADPGANVVVLGDLNDFEFSETVSILEDAGLNDLMNTLPLNQRYSYEFEGNAQVLDHIMVTQPLLDLPLVFDPVHVNAEFADQASDHDPSVVRIALDQAPTVSAGGPYTVDEGASVTLAASGSDPENGSLTYAWDLDDNGTFETPGQSVAFVAGDGPASPTVAVQVTDAIGQTTTDSATIAVKNVPPSATFNAPGSQFAGSSFTLSLTDPNDPSSADTTAGFSYAFDCGDGSGYGPFGSSATVSCATSDTGTRAVKGKIEDQDGGVTEYSGSVDVVVTFDSLCALTRSYARDPSVADSLCAKLRTAAAAPTPKKRDSALEAYRRQVDAQTGPQPDKSFTAAQAAILKQLSRHLQEL